jgi:transcriptional regulator with XRE-family HTH domain
MKNIEIDRRAMIASFLAEQRLTQEGLARAIGRHATTVRSWIGGRSTPELTPEEFMELCKVLGCTPEQLVLMFPGRSRRRAAIKESLTPGLTT